MIRAAPDRGTIRDMTAGPPMPDSRDRRKPIAAAVLGGLAVLLAALNFDEVEVNWIFGTWETPLFVVILVSFLLGGATGFLLAGRRARQRRPR
jgi:uncharacterized integral membrane protein